MLENNVFYRRVNRFQLNTYFAKETYITFDLNDNLKSDHIEELEFTNYLSSNQCNKYFLLVDICLNLYKNNKSINKYFMTDEFDSNRLNSQRVYDIIKAVNGKGISKKALLYKLKFKKDQAIQFYVVKENDVLKLYLIDIYHIVIEAVNQKIGKADRVAIYNARRKCKYDMKEINNKL